jgi:mannose-6-phosphate isomerase-like protein (cupin superfamily)
MTHNYESFHLPLMKAGARLPAAGGQPFVELFRYGAVSVEIFAPRGVDTQQPHAQDEIYVVARGRGDFRNGPIRHAFGPGDVMFVPAGVAHRFENFSDDFLVWVIFCGPEGGHEPR